MHSATYCPNSVRFCLTTGSNFLTVGLVSRAVASVPSHLTGIICGVWTWLEAASKGACLENCLRRPAVTSLPTLAMVSLDLL